ncbi:MAG: hypothetical protein IKS28_08155 [Clostridia bacterium]|nr:hypothetical protein [Clostridia bacterium]
MKKAMMIVFAVAIFAALSLSALAKASPMGNVHVPYATSAPTLDGVLSSGEWDASIKTTFSNKTATIAKSTEATYDASYFTFYFDIYYAWDETYFYAAWDVHADRKYFDQGGNYVRLYLDPGEAIKGYCDGQSNPLKVGMPRLVSATRSDGTGIYGLQQLGFDNINFAETEYGYKATDYGWVFETRILWTDLEKSVAAKTADGSYKLTPAAGMKMRANYDYYDINEAKTVKAFLTTYIDQQNNPKNVWNYSEYADIMLILDAEQVPETGAQSGTDAQTGAPEETGVGNSGGNNAGTGDAVIAVVLSVAAVGALCVLIKIRKR